MPKIYQRGSTRLTFLPTSRRLRGASALVLIQLSASAMGKDWGFRSIVGLVCVVLGRRPFCLFEILVLIIHVLLNTTSATGLTIEKTQMQQRHLRRVPKKRLHT